MKRQRGRNRRSNNNNHNNANRSMDSNGPDVKVRGNASQIYDKYVTLARDAASGGNRVKAENYRQHAEHYLRMMNTLEAAKQAAKEEAEAARAEAEAARADAGDDNNETTSNGDDNRKGRRYPPRARKTRNDDAESKPDNKDASGLEVVTPEASNEPTEVSDETKAPRRRRAPARKKPDPEAEPATAAE